jgi:hypothetical protein
MNDLITANRKIDRAETTVSAELNKVNTSALALSATAIACWATVALFAGTVDTGGPLNLLSALLTTIAG